MAELIGATGFRRFVFWLTYLLGTLSLLSSWLLSQVPRPRHGADLTADLAFRLCAAGLFLISIFTARRIWKSNEPATEQGAITVTQIVLATAWLELVVALFGIIGIAVSRN